MRTLKNMLAILVIAISFLLLTLAVEGQLEKDMLYNNSISQEQYKSAPEGSIGFKAYSSAVAERESLEQNLKTEEGAIPAWFESQEPLVQFAVLMVAVCGSAFSAAYLHGRWVVFTRILKATKKRRA